MHDCGCVCVSVCKVCVCVRVSKKTESMGVKECVCMKCVCASEFVGPCMSEKVCMSVYVCNLGGGACVCGVCSCVCLSMCVFVCLLERPADHEERDNYQGEVLSFAGVCSALGVAHLA